MSEPKDEQAPDAAPAPISPTEPAPEGADMTAEEPAPSAEPAAQEQPQPAPSEPALPAGFIWDQSSGRFKKAPVT